MTNERWVVITTAHRGVFFGLLAAGQEGTEEHLTLELCRCAIFWSGQRGFLGLASHGPEPESKIGAEAPSVFLRDVTSVSECTSAAVESWRSF